MMNKLLNVSDLTFSYDGKRQIFHDISFDIQEGEVFVSSVRMDAENPR